MKEAEARDAAWEIVRLFEEMLDRHGIVIPSADREGGADESCIFGTEYDELMDGVVEILVRGAKIAGRGHSCRVFAAGARSGWRMAISSDLTGSRYKPAGG